MSAWREGIAKGATIPGGAAVRVRRIVTQDIRRATAVDACAKRP